MSRCEVCKSQDNLCVCGGCDEAMLLFCHDHYIEHVKGAHGGYTLPGCVDLATARHIAHAVEALDEDSHG